MQWAKHAGRLSAAFHSTDAVWAQMVLMTPRHTFVPRWWEGGTDSWQLHDGARDPELWLEAAYACRSLVTCVGGLHADHATKETAAGEPTCVATDPRHIVFMLQQGMAQADSTALCVAGSGYTAALQSRRLGDSSFIAIDIDPYLVQSATERLGSMGLHPATAVCDIREELPGRFDRIISTVSIRSVPVSWLAALNPGGRLVTSTMGTGLLIVADKTADGGAVGRVVDGVASVFLGARDSEGYPRPALTHFSRGSVIRMVKRRRRADLPSSQGRPLGSGT
jgi:protein-L-isoaspartate O-methyltransferase